MYLYKQISQIKRSFENIFLLYMYLENQIGVLIISISRAMKKIKLFLTKIKYEQTILLMLSFYRTSNISNVKKKYNLAKIYVFISTFAIMQNNRKIRYRG